MADRRRLGGVFHHPEAPMKSILLSTAALLALAGCATEPATSVAASAAPAQAGASSLKGEVQTGSRLSRIGSDRIVRSVGNQTFRDEVDVRSIGNEVGARGN
jgi:uncharacterized lipoprotein YajG